MSAKWVTTTNTIEGGLRSGELQLLLTNRRAVDQDYVNDISKTKRFLERWSADSEFRDAIAINPAEVCRKYQLEADPEEIRLLWDAKSLGRHDTSSPVPLAVKRYEVFIREKLQYRDIIRREAAPTDKNFRKWRERHIRRTFSELGVAKAHGIVHAPVAFELTKGCSVNCWFCGIAAPHLSDIFRHTRENAGLWRGVLEVVFEVVGPAAGQGFCYWASDPFDNPDYEDFLLDYHQILGRFPQTTTALAGKNPDRTRSLLRLSEANGGVLDRFSLLSLRQLDQIHKEFRATELAFVELITQNEGTLSQKALAGRARETRFQKRADKSNLALFGPGSTGTIACMSGFLFNMVDRSIRLISPCNASDRWPLGYQIFDEATFTTPSDVRSVLKQMIADHMSATLSPDAAVRFRSGLSLEIEPDGFQLFSQTTKHRFSGAPYLREIGETIGHNEFSAGEIALELENKYGIPLVETFYRLNMLFSEGILDEEPRWRLSPGQPLNPTMRETRL